MFRLRAALVVAFLGLSLATPAGAFDGQRKGFVIGGGAGYAPLSLRDSSWYGRSEERLNGIGTELTVGYGWSEHNVVAFTFNEADLRSNATRQDVSVGYFGMIWTHYFGKTGATLFSSVGLGSLFHLVKPDQGRDYGHGAGAAPMLGVGYEFRRHFQVGAYYTHGWTYAGRNGAEYRHVQYNLLVSVRLY